MVFHKKTLKDDKVTLDKNMKGIQLIANRVLIGWGILCAGIAIVLALATAYQFGPGKVSTKTASKHDIRYVMNWCELGDERTEEVLHSYISAGSFSGDHLEAHAIRITHVEEKELKKDASGEGWFRGDEVTGVLSDALDFVGELIPSEELSWFPAKEGLRSSDLYMYPWSIYYHGTRPTAVKLIFIRPKDKMVFYLAAKI